MKNGFVGELIGDLRGKSFLDYGCGAGLFVIHAAEAGGSEVVGVDAEGAVLATARLFAENRGVADRCRFVEGERFPTRAADARAGGGLFDVILMKDVLEHVEDDEGLLRQAAAHLRPDGALIVSTQNALSLNYLTQGVYHRHVLGDKAWFGWDETHLRFYSFLSLTTKLRLAGLQPLCWRANYLIPHRFARRTPSGVRICRVECLAQPDRILGRRLPFNRLGWNIIVKAGVRRGRVRAVAARRAPPSATVSLERGRR
ncbi:MAG: methyltransferase domain-containing protein [Actinomycetes bacterium]